MIPLFITTLVFAAPLLVASYTDFTSMKIPNKVSLAMAIGFFLTLPFHWQGLPMFGEHLLVGITFFAIGFAMFAFGWLGGGDAKLMAAIALWMSWGDVTGYVVYVTICGAVLGLFLIISKNFAPVKLRTSALGMKLYQGGKDMPYGLALAAGSLLIWPSTQVFQAVAG